MACLDDDKIEDAGGESELERDVYLDERRKLIEGEAQASQGFDRTVITLSAAAFALSITFIQLIREVMFPWLLIVAWICFALALMTILTSFLMSQYAFRKQRDMLDNCYEQGGNQEENPLTKWTERLNCVALVAFMAGVVFFAVFGALNLLKE